MKIRGHDVTARVVLDGIGQFGRGTMIGFHVVYGPSRLGLDVPVESRVDAATKVEAVLTQMGHTWS